MTFRWFLIGLLLLTACHSPTARRAVSDSTTVILNRADEQVVVGGWLAFLAETDKPLTLEQVLKRPFTPILADEVNFGHTDRVHWIRIQVQNRVAGQQPDWLLRVISLSSTVCDAYLVDHAGRVQAWPAGIRFPFRQRPFDALTFDFPLNLPDTQARTVYLRLAGVNSQQYIFDFLSPRLALVFARNFENLMSLYFGALLAMLAYNGFLFLSMRDRGYLLYTLYLAAMTCLHLCMYGLGFRFLWPDSPEWAMRAQNVFSGLTTVTASAFAFYFLGIRQRLPSIQWLFYGYMVMGLGISGLALWHNSAKLTFFITLTVMPVILTFWITAIIVWRRGYAPALLYVLGWFVLFITIGLFSLKNAGIWAGANFVNFLMPIGTATEMLLFSFGLGYRINLSRHEQAQLQQQRAEAETRALRSQMNPHFVFNCMNTINYYILSQQPDQASAFLQDFSKLIRKVLEHSRLAYIPIADELTTLRLYLDLEQERANHQFAYQIHADQLPATLLIPPLLIQPFVENAILHGLRHKTDGPGLLIIRFWTDSQKIWVSVDDNGVGRAASAVINAWRHSAKQSLGVTVTAERLAALGPGASVTITDGSPGVQVRLGLPIVTGVSTQKRKS